MSKTLKQVEGELGSELERTFETQLKQIGLEERGLTWVREHVFHPERKWAFDFAFVEQKVAIEIEGGVWKRGRHTRPTGFIKDCEKYNAAAEMGWTVFRYPSTMVESGSGIQQINRYFGGTNDEPQT